MRGRECREAPSVSSEERLKEAICEAGRRLHAKNLVGGSDGNISVRLGEENFLCTPGGASLGFLEPDDIVIAGPQGQKVSGKHEVTSEFFTHLAAYRVRPDINSVIHAHPPKVVALTLAGVPFDPPYLPEMVYHFGGVPTARYATPGTAEGAETVGECIVLCDAVIADRHGAFTVGTDVFSAYAKMEKLEHAAESVLWSHALGNCKTLEDEWVERLVQLRQASSEPGRVHVSGFESTEPPKGPSAGS